MFARNVSIHLKPNSSAAFHRIREFTFLAPGGAEAVAISLWDKKENADAYNRNAFPEVMKNLNKFIEGTPAVKTYEVANPTFHTLAATVAA